MKTNTTYTWALCAFSALSLFSSPLFAQQSEEQQGLLQGGQIHGNVDIYAQSYNRDSLIGAPIVPEKSGINAFTNLIFTKGNFSAGVRIESYLPPVQGFDPRFGNEQIGIPFRYATYSKEGLEVTAGNFYEQFGSGMILRSYEERALGIDNAFDGVRLKYSPFQGVYLKGLIGDQRYYWDKSDGFVRAFDGELQINELVQTLESSPLRLSLGGSFVSKFQERGASDLELPENVGSYAGRMQLDYKNFGVVGEYVYKINDPSADNNYIYRPGQGLFLSATYSRKGFGLNVQGKTMDNMSFRSDRNALINDVFINYLPALTRQHTYNLAATLYPYATQPNGEIGIQADMIYKIKRGSKLGGKYGTTIQINASFINGHDTTQLSSVDELATNEYLPDDPTRQGYDVDLFSIGDEVYYRDYNIEIDRKFSKKLKVKLTYVHFQYNIDLVQGTATNKSVFAEIGIVDVLYKISKKHSIRIEAQTLFSEQDQGDWAFGLIEYGISPHWFFTVLDQYNYDNPNPDLEIHYPTAQVVYVNKANRFSLGYGRQRAGIFCVGGVCRNVPAANGLTLAITSSF